AGHPAVEPGSALPAFIGRFGGHCQQRLAHREEDMTRFSRRTVLQLAGASALAGALPIRAYAQSAVPLKWMTWGGTANIQKIIGTVASEVPAIGAGYAVTPIDGGQGDQ